MAHRRLGISGALKHSLLKQQKKRMHSFFFFLFSSFAVNKHARAAVLRALFSHNTNTLLSTLPRGRSGQDGACCLGGRVPSWHQLFADVPQFLTCVIANLNMDG